MGIFMLKHSSVGRSTHAARTAGAHIRYIARPGAEPDLQAERMPVDPAAARNWFDRQERAMRANGRVADKIIIALPLELHPLQRRRLVKAYCEDVTKRQASWFAAIHQSGSDRNNPHAHIIIHDRSVTTGKRVARLSGKNSTVMLRRQWETHLNAALRAAGIGQQLAAFRRHRNGTQGQPQQPARCLTAGR